MDIKLYTDNGQHLIFLPGLPDGYTGKVLTDSKIFTAVNQGGSIIVQEYVTPHYSLRYSIYKIIKKIVLSCRSNRAGFHVRLMMKGGLTHRIKEIGRIHVKQGKYLLVYVRNGECMSRFEKNSEYQMLDLYFSEELLEPYKKLYPQIAEIIGSQAEPLIFNHAADTQSPLLELVKELLTTRLTKTMSRVFYDEKIQELLALFIEEMDLKEMNLLPFSKEELIRLDLARKYIEENFRQHFTIQQMARESGINEFKLKVGFRRYFGMGIFDCLIAARMQRARVLVEEGDQPMKQIASMVGYKRLTSFVTAFKKYYGKSPGKMRYNK